MLYISHQIGLRPKDDFTFTGVSDIHRVLRNITSILQGLIAEAIPDQ
jgi:hypothetical protein